MVATLGQAVGMAYVVIVDSPLAWGVVVFCFFLKLDTIANGRTG